MRLLARAEFVRRALSGLFGVWTSSLTRRHFSSNPGESLLAREGQKLYLPTDFAPYPWMEFALREYGIREISSRGRTVNVTAYLKATGVGQSSDETPWCSAFVNWCMLMAGFPGTRQATARSWLEWGQSLSFPVYGCVTVLWRGSRNSSLGHVGLFVGFYGDNLLLLGGNQGRAVSVRPYSKERVIGLRWLDGFPIPEET
jgi:uncharacterized protein (TIGR02594 family)